LAFAGRRVQNRPFCGISTEVIKVAALQTAREYGLTCTATAESSRFGTHSAHAELDGFADIAGL
jgi:hypothetical protein